MKNGIGASYEARKQNVLDKIHPVKHRRFEKLPAHSRDYYYKDGHET